MTSPIFVALMIANALYLPAVIASAFPTRFQRRLQWLAIALAAASVGIAAIGSFWIAMAAWIFCLSLATYNLVRAMRTARDAAMTAEWDATVDEVLGRLNRRSPEGPKH